MKKMYFFFKEIEIKSFLKLYRDEMKICSNSKTMVENQVNINV